MVEKRYEKRMPLSAVWSEMIEQRMMWSVLR